MLATMMNYPLTLPSILEHAGRLYGKIEIVSRMPDKSLHTYTYADFYRRARLLAEALQKAGLKRGDRVGTLAWNHYAHLEAYFGIPCAGGVLHTLNLRLSPVDLAYIINHAGDRFIIVDDVLLPLLERVKDQINVEKVIVIPLTRQPVAAGLRKLRELPANRQRQIRPIPTSTKTSRWHVLHLRDDGQAERRRLFASLDGPAHAGRVPAGQRRLEPERTSCCPSCRCSMSMPGDCPSPRR